MEDKSKITQLENTINSLQRGMAALFKKVEMLEFRLEAAEKENLEYIENNIDLDSELERLKDKDKKRDLELRNASREIESLKSENDKLRNKIHKKNSRNSSIPPSHDYSRPKSNQSLREKSDKKVGGQEGHKGNTLEFNSNPTEVLNHLPKVCENCGNKLVGDFSFVQKRQVVDLPKFVPDVIEHRVYKCTCGCGQTTLGKFPKGVKAPVSYGPRTEATIAYLSVRQYVPIKRIEEMLRQLFGLNISSSTICNKLAQSSDKLLKYYTWIQNQIEKSRVVGSDETGCKVNGEKGWMWTWQNELFTFLKYSDTRGFKAVTDTLPKGLPNSILVHDSLHAQFKVPSKGHQMCIAHLLRELNFFIELGDKWSIKFKQKLKDSLLLLYKIKAYPTKNYRRSINKLNREADKILGKKKKGKGKLIAFRNRMIDKRESLFRFLDDPSIPPDNNASERAIRNVKVKIKVSGMFKTEFGADQFAVIRSVIDTFVKRRQPVMKSLIKVIS